MKPRTRQPLLTGRCFRAIAWVIPTLACLQPISAETSLLPEFLEGPMKDTREIVFAVRALNQTDGHWYANFGYYAHDPDRKAYAEGGRLCRLDLRTGVLTTLLEDSRGGVRDPQVHYLAEKILFSYRKGGTENYHLYEINIDGSGLRQLTSGPFDDIEPVYLPDGGIVFVSSRCNRWVNCWLTKVAVLHRCDADGSQIRAISSNNEHDNTPWPLSDGRILYTRWEYVDRSQVHFHHLWAMNPDGTSQMVWFGNLNPGTTMIDAKPIPGSDKIVASFSPGHGQREHDGVLTVVDPNRGPDAGAFAKSISPGSSFRDPWAFSEGCFMAAKGSSLVVMDADGRSEEIFRLPAADVAAGLECHEPRPIVKHAPERIVPTRSVPASTTGRFLISDVHQGRNMDGIQPGEIRTLLVMETLPMPIHYTGGMEPISYGGTFTLERILGTVPVENDGSAFFEVPALRSLFFVALDKNDLAVKRMQSFTSVMPGETLSCVGCHEHRAQAPGTRSTSLLALQHPPHAIEPIPGVPDVFDFPRDVQPVLNALCLPCHGYESTSQGGPRAGGILLSGDHGPMFSHSYYTLTVNRLFSDGRNQPRSNYPPRSLGSSASRLLTLLDGSHHGVRATSHQQTLLRLWIESAAAYPGTYAALGTGMIGNYAENHQINTGADWPATRAAAEVTRRRCFPCHQEPGRLLPLSLADERDVSFWQPDMADPRLRTSRHIVFNLTRPEKSLVLLAPLASRAGGWGLCQDPDTGAPVEVFASTDDPGYRALLALCVAGKEFLDTNRRFDMPGFTPRAAWLREMKRYGVLDKDLKPGTPIDVYALEQDYWKSLWHRPPAGNPAGQETALR